MVVPNSSELERAFLLVPVPTQAGATVADGAADQIVLRPGVSVRSTREGQGRPYAIKYEWQSCQVGHHLALLHAPLSWVVRTAWYACHPPWALSQFTPFRCLLCIYPSQGACYQSPACNIGQWESAVDPAWTCSPSYCPGTTSYYRGCGLSDNGFGRPLGGPDAYTDATYLDDGGSPVTCGVDCPRTSVSYDDGNPGNPQSLTRQQEDRSGATIPLIRPTISPGCIYAALARATHPLTPTLSLGMSTSPHSLAAPPAPPTSPPPLLCDCAVRSPFCFVSARLWCSPTG